MDISEDILKSVVFICLKSNMSTKPIGTGFIMSVVSKNKPEVSYTYLVTASHIIEKAYNTGLQIVIKINTKEGTVKELYLPKEARFFEHPNNSSSPVDVAVIPFPVPNDTDIRHIPITMCLRNEEIEEGKIKIGNDVFIVGLFAPHHGKSKNIPIVRFGNIALMSNEKVSVKWKNAEIDAFLIEARSIGGISGSPVFLRTPLHRIDPEDGKLKMQPLINIRLTGLVHGHWSINESKIDEITEEKNVNMGIAIVIPAFKIFETIMQDELEKIRSELDKKH